MLRLQENLKDSHNPANQNIRFARLIETNRNSHFSRIATIYKNLRTTDIAPILFIRKKLQDISILKGADVGCGCGRYTAELLRFAGDNIVLTCVDENEDMLKQLKMNLSGKDLHNLIMVRSPASNLQVETNSLDFIVTFNAVHHFDLAGFLNESARTLKDNRYLFIYTRLRSQNKRNIWGRYFPKFHDKETRLYCLEGFKMVLEQIRTLKLDSFEYYKYKRKASTNWLIKRAMQHHYSTFDLYDGEEFNDALMKFRKNITNNYSDRNDVFWEDENIMFVISRNPR